MSPVEVIDRVTADGVALALSGDDAITATGDQRVIDRWLPMIRDHKAAIIDALLDRPRFARNNLFHGDSLRSLNNSYNVACTTCQHFRTPGKSAGYCGGRDDLPLAYGVNHPLRKLPEDGGANCDHRKGQANDAND